MELPDGTHTAEDIPGKCSSTATAIPLREALLEGNDGEGSDEVIFGAGVVRSFAVYGLSETSGGRTHGPSAVGDVSVAREYIDGIGQPPMTHLRVRRAGYGLTTHTIPSRSTNQTPNNWENPSKSLYFRCRCQSFQGVQVSVAQNFLLLKNHPRSLVKPFVQAGGDFDGYRHETGSRKSSERRTFDFLCTHATEYMESGVRSLDNVVQKTV
ncbi:hypothetical protein AXG93_3457s1420 [Marchantia polymorpha subsp. ruderalis]|uniref:Uncharacterized protein n=1 Tax=Marchantia polymorpha subsp. ruderalis TaxID=1480154 RepID=A0A176W161_MARPO|nr:hypothetical protein AXG93_3457s1420 [Marchantia polymorpha subsp. ruderalis]